MHEFTVDTNTDPHCGLADCPHWFERLPLARWGWRELNLFGWPLLAAIDRACYCSADPWCWLAIVPAVLLGLAALFLPRSAAHDSRRPEC